MKKRSTKINVITSLLLQLVSLASGLIVPRLILTTFGSEVNGLVSSLTQFLNYISLLEGGVSSVIMAALYKPLAEDDSEKVSAVVSAANGFFKKIGSIFIVYALGVGIIYPLAVSTSFSWGYVFSLTLILAASLFIQYFFSLTYRLLLDADRRGFVVSLTQTAFVIIKLIIVVVVIKLCPSIHIVKLVGAAAFIIQPLVYSGYVKKHYAVNKKSKPDNQAIKQRWDGFGQNLAFFIHTNTDVVVLTIFGNLLNVSIYSVYFLIASALKNLVMAVSSAVVPALGNSLISDDSKAKNEYFDNYEFGMMFITTFAFVCGAMLITPFVLIYTSGVNDADYYQPVFGVLLMMAEAVYCYRDPYVSAAYVSGHFRQTARFAYIEAGMNIVVSIILVIRFGLIGVAVGTLVSMLYRMIAHVVYLKKNILFRPINKWLKTFVLYVTVIACSLIASNFMFKTVPDTYITWMIRAIPTALFVLAEMLVVFGIFDRKHLKVFFRNIVKTGNKKK